MNISILPLGLQTSVFLQPASNLKHRIPAIMYA